MCTHGTIEFVLQFHGVPNFVRLSRMASVKSVVFVVKKYYTASFPCRKFKYEIIDDISKSNAIKYGGHHYHYF